MSAALPQDVARCAGLEEMKAGARPQCAAECLNCLRRTIPSGRWQPWISAPKFDGVCPEKITEESRA